MDDREGPPNSFGFNCWCWVDSFVDVFSSSFRFFRGCCWWERICCCCGDCCGCCDNGISSPLASPAFMFRLILETETRYVESTSRRAGNLCGPVVLRRRRHANHSSFFAVGEERTAPVVSVLWLACWRRLRRSTACCRDNKLSARFCSSQISRLPDYTRSATRAPSCPLNHPQCASPLCVTC